MEVVTGTLKLDTHKSCTVYDPPAALLGTTAHGMAELSSY